MLFKQRTLAVMLAAACGVAAHAEWAPTQTPAMALEKATGLQTAMEVAPSREIHVVVSLRLRNQADLTARTDLILAGKSTDYLSSAQFLDRHAPTAQQAQKVADYLVAQGFRNVTVAPNRLLVEADGVSTSVKSAFNTSLRTVVKDGVAHYANASAAMVPKELADTVLAVHGLHDLFQYHTLLQVVSPDAGSKAASAGHSPTDFAKIYNAASLPAASNTVVGIISEGKLTQTVTDLNSFASSVGFAKPSTTIVNAGKTSSDTSGIDEWNLDSQNILAAAGGQLKQMIFYSAYSMSNADITAAYNKAVSDNKAKVINVSLGECETDSQSDGSITTDDQIFQAAVSQGQIFSISTGDSGSNECGGKTAKQSYPAVSPYVMAIGGTSLKTNGTTYVSESAWTGTGGGPSTIETAPSWQKGVLGTSTKRGVPDVAFDADPSTGALVLVNGQNVQIGGTSLSAPLFSGFWARIESAHNNKQNYPAPSIYKYFPANTSLYHDVTTGSNGSYTAKAGWDYTTGWGSLNVGNLSTFITNTSGF